MLDTVGELIGHDESQFALDAPRQQTDTHTTRRQRGTRLWTRKGPFPNFRRPSFLPRLRFDRLNALQKVRHRLGRSIGNTKLFVAERRRRTKARLSFLKRWRRGSIITLTKTIQDAVQECRRAKKNLKSSGDEPASDRFTATEFLISEEIAVLRSYGYSEKEFEAWVNCLADSDLTQAARNLLSIQRTGLLNELSVPSVPLSAIRILMYDPRLTAPVFRHIMILFQNLLQTPRPDGRSPMWQNSDWPIRRNLAFDDFGKLIAHAGKFWPESLPSLASTITTYIKSVPGLWQDPASESSNQKLAAFLRSRYNGLLIKLAHPIPVAPMRASAYQERAQFELVSCMARHSPSVSVTREGYEAILNVQLARGKSPVDRDWASLKSKGWPPFKQSKMQSDEDKDRAYGTSNAARVLLQQQQAGYPLLPSDLALSIYTGWDIDGSPTVQTRVTPRSSKSAKHESALWAARIRATRTLPEAWAGFLECQRSGIEPGNLEYAAVLEKVIADRKRKRSKRKGAVPFGRRREVFPGDGREVNEPPISPHEAVYNSTSPPSFHELWIRVQSTLDDIDDYVFSLFLNNVPNFQLGMEIWNSWQLKYPELKRTLFNPSAADLRQPYQIGPTPLNALIRFLTTYAKESASLINDEAMQSDSDSQVKLSQDCFGFALDLMHRQKPKQDTSWTIVFAAISKYRREIIASVPSSHSFVEIVSRLYLMHAVRSSMRAANHPMSFQVFFCFCSATYKAAEAARNILTDANDEDQSALGDDSVTWVELVPKSIPDYELGSNRNALHRANDVLSKGAHFLRSQFQRIVQTSSDDVPPSDQSNMESYALPRMLQIPSPAILHEYIRALGVLGDHEGLLSIAQWLHRYHRDLDPVIEEEAGGAHRRRMALIALRVFLEPPSFTTVDDAPVFRTCVKASEEIISLAREEIDAIEGWGGWASDEERTTYVYNGSTNHRRNR